MTKRETQKAEYEAEVNDDGFDATAYENRLLELQRMEQQTRTCSTCHWWFKGMCVFHTGMNEKPRSTKAKLKFTGGGILKTAEDFGCTEWRKDERPGK